MKKLLASVLISAQLAMTAPSFAQETPVKTPTAITIPDAPTPLPGEPDVGAAVSPMRRMQQAPFTGVLLSPRAIATIIAELNAIQDLVKIETNKVRGEEQAKCTFEKSEIRTAMEADAKVSRAKLDAKVEELKLVQERLKKAEESAPDPLLWSGLGFGAGVLVTVLASVAIVTTVK